MVRRSRGGLVETRGVGSVATARAGAAASPRKFEARAVSEPEFVLAQHRHVAAEKFDLAQREEVPRHGLPGPRRRGSRECLSSKRTGGRRSVKFRCTAILTSASTRTRALRQGCAQRHSPKRQTLFEQRLAHPPHDSAAAAVHQRLQRRARDRRTAEWPPREASPARRRTSARATPSNGRLAPRPRPNPRSKRCA